MGKDYLKNMFGSCGWHYLDTTHTNCFLISYLVLPIFTHFLFRYQCNNFMLLLLLFFLKLWCNCIVFECYLNSLNKFQLCIHWASGMVKTLHLFDFIEHLGLRSFRFVFSYAMKIFWTFRSAFFFFFVITHNFAISFIFLCCEHLGMHFFPVWLECPLQSQIKF